MLELNDITLVTVNGGISPDNSLKALLYSSQDLKFADIKLLSHVEPSFLPKKIKFIRIPPLNFSQYSDFIIKNLSDYIDSKFALIVQADGFVINPTLWREEFLSYDYIGAPWKLSKHYNYIRVGNGGFSLRSKKFLEISKKECPTYGFYEDHIVCITHRNIFLKHGIKYAPLEVAMKFSLEHPIEECEYDLTKTFGFHGNIQYCEMLKNWKWKCENDN